MKTTTNKVVRASRWFNVVCAAAVSLCGVAAAVMGVSLALVVPMGLMAVVCWQMCD